MGKLIAIVGTTGVGKTTLARLLCRELDFHSGLEEHDNRPFQASFKQNPQFALANQVDYLLARAEQETELRSDPRIGVLDGGLEMDTFGYTRLFKSHGWLSDEEAGLCKRLYAFIRTILPPPDLFIHLTAPQDVIVRRLDARVRINIATKKDIALLSGYLKEWIGTLDPSQFISYDVGFDDPNFQATMPALVLELKRRSIL